MTKLRCAPAFVILLLLSVGSTGCMINYCQGFGPQSLGSQSRHLRARPQHDYSRHIGLAQTDWVANRARLLGGPASSGAPNAITLGRDAASPEGPLRQLSIESTTEAELEGGGSGKVFRGWNTYLGCPRRLPGGWPDWAFWLFLPWFSFEDIADPNCSELNFEESDQRLRLQIVEGGTDEIAIGPLPFYYSEAHRRFDADTLSQLAEHNSFALLLGIYAQEETISPINLNFAGSGSLRIEADSLCQDHDASALFWGVFGWGRANGIRYIQILWIPIAVART